MLLMFRLPNADVCWAAAWRAKRYLASELRKQLNVVDNWSWCGIHSSLSEAGLIPSRGGWTAHMCVKVRLSSHFWLYIETASLIRQEKRVFTQQKGKKLYAQKMYLYHYGYLIKQTGWALRNIEIFHFQSWMSMCRQLWHKCFRKYTFKHQKPLNYIKEGPKKLSHWLQRKTPG